MYIRARRLLQGREGRGTCESVAECLAPMIKPTISRFMRVFVTLVRVK